MIKVYKMALCPGCIRIEDQLKDNPGYEMFATPMMIALMEKAATLSIEPVLAEGQSKAQEI